MTIIRVARQADYEAIGELSVRAYAGAGSLPENNIDYAAVLRNAVDRAEQAELLVAVEGDKPLGTVTVVRPGGRYAELAQPGELEFRMLAVAPDAAGNGVGQALVQAVIDRARAEGARRVVLCVQERAVPAQRLYRRLGFERLPGRDWVPVPSIKLLAFALDL